MSDQKQELSNVTGASVNSEIQANDGNQASTNDEDDKPVLPHTENSNISNEPAVRPRLSMPQDIRYATEQNDREKLTAKYNNYQVSDKNFCHIRFLTDHRQKRILLDRNEEELSNLQSISKNSNVNIILGYQTPSKLSFKVFGTEANVRKCLIDVMSRIFKQVSQLKTQHETETNEKQIPTENLEKFHESEISAEKLHGETPESAPSVPAAATNDVDTSITGEKPSLIPITSNADEEKFDSKDENTEQEQLKFVPLERKPEYTFVLLITSQGQEALKKNWNFFGGSLQQRLSVTVTNPLKLTKFGDKKWQNEFSITGELHENIIDAALQITAFINDVLGIPTQQYKDEDQTISDHSSFQRMKTNNNNNNNNTNNDYYQQRRYEYNTGYRQSSAQHQGQTSPFNNYHERTFFNRGRNGTFEQIILIRSNCAARIVGTRGSNLRRIQTKCHLRDIVVARHPNQNGYVECALSAYQTRNLGFAIDTIRSYLRNEDDQAVQVLDSHFIDTPLPSSPYQNSPHNEQPQHKGLNQNLEHGHQYNFSNNHDRQQSVALTTPIDLSQKNKNLGFTTRSLNLNNAAQITQPSYNFQNTPSFDFTHRPTSASRKTDKRPGEVNDSNNASNTQIRTSNESQHQQYGGSSSSDSSSVSPRHKSKRTCPETKEIECTTDDGFWIQKQYYHALDDASKELFDSLLDKLEKIRISSEENAVRKQQRLVGRNRPNKARLFTTSISSITQVNDDADLVTKPIQDNKTEESANSDEQKEARDSTVNQPETTTIAVEEK